MAQGYAVTWDRAGFHTVSCCFVWCQCRHFRAFSLRFPGCGWVWREAVLPSTAQVKQGPGSGKGSPSCPGRNLRTFRARTSPVSAGLRLVRAPRSTGLASALPRLRVSSLAAPLPLSARASLSLQRPALPQPHWQSRFEACQPLACLQHDHGTRHVLAALAHRQSPAHSSLIPCSFSKHPLVPGPRPSSCQAGLWAGVVSDLHIALRMSGCSEGLPPGRARQWQESTVVGA